jgi:pyrroloquinoline quinone (PQQ) biosynthesis protein C
MTPVEDLEKLNDRKKHYRIIDDETIQSLIKYYKLEHEHRKEVLKFVKNTEMKGDTLE